MREILAETTLKRLKIGQVDCEIITNPHKALSEKEKQQILSLANQILYCTTGIDRSAKQVESFLFGIEDRGRVLCLFNSQENLVGFASFHLLNRDGEFVTYKGKTILHAGSGHILPKFQGFELWLKGAKHYLNSLPEQIRLKYIEGFT